MVLMSTPGEVLMSNTYIEWCYSHHSFVFLHYHITSFPGHFENMVKKLEEASDGESRRDLAGSGGANTPPWERTLTHCHTALCSPPCRSLCGWPTSSKARSTQLDTALWPLFHTRRLLLLSCTAIPVIGRKPFLKK